MPDSPRFVLVTGLSGAGKSQALHFLEDFGYFCVDNLPAPLMPTLAELLVGANPRRRRIAVCLDARAGEDLSNLPGYLDAVTELGVRPDTLFLDSADEVLVRRYSETRRRHPSSPSGNVEEGIRRERELLEPIRARSDLVLDTSKTSVAELRERIAATFLSAKKSQEMLITVLSFGFKYGVPPEADLVLDVRFLPNPHYDPELQPHTGEEPDVRDFVLENAEAREFMERLKGLLKFLLPRYAAEPKSYLTIAVGCTGGRHRSVTVAHELSVFLRDLKYNARLRHRDVSKPGGDIA
ncbi:MAG: RNase adapter RapZ [Candidatus Hydrogenedentes bacterium]|nr:RNase adapter RapZ [Candidatus Hydrogenedentota bacterium]